MLASSSRKANSEKKRLMLVNLTLVRDSKYVPVTTGAIRYNKSVGCR